MRLRAGWAFWPLVPAAGLMAAVLVYGHFRTANVETDPGLKIALIQGNIDIQLDNPDDFRKTIDDRSIAISPARRSTELPADRSDRLAGNRVLLRVEFDGMSCLDDGR